MAILFPQRHSNLHILKRILNEYFIHCGYDVGAEIFSRDMDSWDIQKNNRSENIPSKVLCFCDT